MMSGVKLMFRSGNLIVADHNDVAIKSPLLS
jgi:hypothetical protein